MEGSNMKRDKFRRGRIEVQRLDSRFTSFRSEKERQKLYGRGCVCCEITGEVKLSTLMAEGWWCVCVCVCVCVLVKSASEWRRSEWGRVLGDKWPFSRSLSIPCSLISLAISTYLSLVCICICVSLSLLLMCYTFLDFPSPDIFIFYFITGSKKK